MSHTFVNLMLGEPAPWFHAASGGNPRYAIDTAAGRYIVVCFLGSAGEPTSAMALKAVDAHRRLFDDVRASFFGVTVDPRDQTLERSRERLPGVRFFRDFDGAVSRAYGAAPREAKLGESMPYRRFWIVLDPTLRVLNLFPFHSGDVEHAAVFAYLDALPPPDCFAGVRLQAPILYLANVFEAELCQTLIDLYEAHGGEESGFMREVDGKTVHAFDHSHKRRRDYNIGDQRVIQTTRARISRRIVPEIAKVCQFQATRMERYIVACYSAENGGHFRQHRDNTTKGTAHRRFAVSVNLNADFDGGEVSFPEYGPQSFKPPPGGAVVFSCSLLHAVSRVTRGRRYAFLPFLYDEPAAKLRAENNRFLDEGVGAYVHEEV